MASLQQLLSEEGFERGKLIQTQKSSVKCTFMRKSKDDSNSIAFPIFICHDRKRIDNSKKKTCARTGSSVFSSIRGGSDSERSKNDIEEDGPRREDPAMDDIAVKAVISVLSGYIGRYLKDESFRNTIRDKCYSVCLQRKKQDCSDNGIFANMELGIESIEKLVEEDRVTKKKELRLKTLRNSIRLLSIVASLNSKNSKNGFTSGTPNSYLSACAQLYLSIVYKIEKNDRISARHLLQVFCDSPFIGRTHLLPDLWEHFFLPHLLHLKIWYAKELEFVSEYDNGEGEKMMKALGKVYNDQMDAGTALVALYYKQWLKVGAQPPPVPSVPLPSRPSYLFSRRTSPDYLGSPSSINKNLYQTVFGPNFERMSMEFNNQNGGLEEQEKACTHEDSFYNVHVNGERANQRSHRIYKNRKPELWPEAQKSNYFRFLTCKGEATETLVNKSYIARNGSIRNEEKLNVPSSDLSRAITTICSSASKDNCELAIRTITKAWLDSHGNPSVESALSKAPVIEAMLEVLFVSNDGEILELVISVLSELVARNEVNRQIVLNSDPQLGIFIKLLRSSNLFLKAAVLLYLLKPKAKQMISMEWVPLVLRVLEFGEQMQTLFTVRCSPQVAAFYLLDQLLAGFDEDRNLENARQVVSLGGLSLLVGRIERGDIHERNNAASIIYCCIRADGSCRNYVANNLNNTCIIELLILGNQKSNGCALALLTELICVNRRTYITKFLNGLINGVCSLNTMHIFLVYLQRASPEERPLVAAILLQLDLMNIEESPYGVAVVLQGDVSKCSIYREEVIDAIIESLDSQKCKEEVQEQSARALVMLGGRFSYTGEASMEKWLLKQAGFDDRSVDSFQDKDISVDEFMHSNEEEATENWQRKVAAVLLTCGNKRLLEALSDSIANSIPKLARASLVTVSWMSCFLPSIGDEIARSTACSILIPQLLESLNYDRDLEERVLASFSLLSLIKSSDCISTLSGAMDKKLVGLLQNLSLVTWTANELISIISFNPKKNNLIFM